MRACPITALNSDAEKVAPAPWPEPDEAARAERQVAGDREQANWRADPQDPPQALRQQISGAVKVVPLRIELSKAPEATLPRRRRPGHVALRSWAHERLGQADRLGRSSDPQRAVMVPRCCREPAPSQVSDCRDRCH